MVEQAAGAAAAADLEVVQAVVVLVGTAPKAAAEVVAGRLPMPAQQTPQGGRDSNSFGNDSCTGRLWSAAVGVGGSDGF